MSEQKRQYFAILACFLFGMGCVTPVLPSHSVVNTSPLTFSTGTKNKVSQLFVVTDASGTMFSEKTFPEAKALTQGFVQAMPASPPEYQAALISFGGQVQEGKALDAFDRAALQSAADDLRLVGDVIGFGGTTPLHQIFESITSTVAEKKGLVAVLIISDHQPDSEVLAMVAAAELVNSHSDGVCIHTVQVGDSAAGATFAQSLSDLTSCGSSRSSSALNSAAAFNALAKDVFYGESTVVRSTPVVRSTTDDPCKGDLTLRGATFEFGKAVLNSDGRSRLEPVAAQLNQCADVHVEITGHTDSVGNNAYNQGLSERRANAVKDYFVVLGVDPSRLRSDGRGEDSPVASNETDAGRAQNRRVELHPVIAE